MLNQLVIKNKVTLVHRQLTNVLLLKRNNTINNRIITPRLQLRNFTDDSEGNEKDKIQERVKEEEEELTKKYEPAFDEDLDNPKPLPIFENVKKEAETDRIRNRIYAFPNIREDMFKGVKKIKMKELLCKFFLI